MKTYFYCHEYKLVIEVDGVVHNYEKSNGYDLGRTSELDIFGIKVIRFTNDQIIYKLDQVITRILEVLTELTPLQGGRGANNRRWVHEINPPSGGQEGKTNDVVVHRYTYLYRTFQRTF